MNEVSSSGFVVDSFEGVNDHFTSLEVMRTHGHNRLARAKRFGRWYLLKGLGDDEIGQQAYHEMLTKEFDIMMRMQHPGVAQAISLEDVPGMGKCIVIEWVEGVTLTEWLKTEPSRNKRYTVALQLMEALAHIHQHDVVHRDIKPTNIMVTTTGQNVKIIDFGLADTNVHTTLKQPAGTTSYMAPEQAVAAAPDPRNDIYSLGLVLEQMRLGFLYRKPIARCLKSIDKRYASVEELQTDLRRRRTHLRYTTITVAALLTVGASATIATLVARMHPASENMASQQVDSLRQRLDNAEMEARMSRESQDSLHRQITNMHDSMATVNAANRRLSDEQAARDDRQQKVQQAINEGIVKIDAINTSTHLMQHLDTLTNGRYVWIDWRYLSQRGRNKALPEYMISIRDRFSTKELSEIQYALNEHCDQYEGRVQTLTIKKGVWDIDDDARNKIPH